MSAKFNFRSIVAQQLLFKHIRAMLGICMVCKDPYFIFSCNLYTLNDCSGNEGATSSNGSVNVTCSDQFYFDESSDVCKPECAWSVDSAFSD